MRRHGWPDTDGRFRRLAGPDILHDADDDSSAVKREIGALLLSVLDAGRDDLIARACGRWMGSPMALLIRRCAEELAEQVEVDRAGVLHVTRLFTIPVLLSFTENVPESQIDGELKQLRWQRDVLPRLAVLGLDASGAFIVPEFLRFEDLRELPLSAIRRGAAAMTALNMPSALATVFRGSAGGSKRSTAFLRFVVGGMQLVGEASMEPAGMRCEELESLLRSRLSSYLGAKVEVQSQYDGCFHASLYGGMWTYQGARIADIGAAASRCGRGVQAFVEAMPQPHDDRLRLTFFDKSRTVVGTYLLDRRPAEPFETSLARLAAQLHAAGVEQVLRSDELPRVPRRKATGFSLPI